MIVKGRLKQISSGFRQLKSTASKYDFIEVGNFMIRNVKMDSYISDRMDNLLGDEVELSIVKPWALLPKSIVAIKTSEGTVYRNERSMRLFNGIFGYIFIATISLAWLIIPYTILYFSLGSMGSGYGQNSNDGLLTFFIIGHIGLSIVITNYLKKAYNAFGKENSGHTVV
ncbi:hypothetical protein [Owenweeksia hongkongensis]|uniref:hypothetical protein n=1 Tax=Owenweeksia hongkongensis TaxID=253245 RepID=UPI003A909624